MKAIFLSVILISAIQISSSIRTPPVDQDIFDKKDYFNTLYNGTNWCASILLGLPYHIDTDFLRNNELDSTELQLDADISDHHNLGEMNQVDECCHSYQHCVQSTPVHNLHIENPKHSQHCDCEFGMQRCLRDFDSEETNDFGRLHFFITDQCVMKSHPVLECQQFDTILGATENEENRCLEYVTDEDRPQEYQLLDLPFYYNEEKRRQLRVDF